MKASTLIKILKNLVKENGDKDVYMKTSRSTNYHPFNYVEPIEIEFEFGAHEKEVYALVQAVEE